MLASPLWPGRHSSGWEVWGAVKRKALEGPGLEGGIRHAVATSDQASEPVGALLGGRSAVK